MSIHLFGIRHHGPGSARSLKRALEALKPDVILVEGPPDADAVLPLLSHGEMEPPVALLVYDPEKPDRAVYYPFATYSPEWQAIAYGQREKIPVRFMDLPQTHRMAIAAKAEEEFRAALEAQLPTAGTDTPPTPSPDNVEPSDPIAGQQADTDGPVPGIETEAESGDGEVDLTYLFQDPLQAIAEAAGYPDGETWWEQIIEQRRDAADQFTGIVEMMCAVRDASPVETPESECQREAFMRQTIRAAEKEGFQKIAVVCGAWHTPALPGSGEDRTIPTAKDDTATLKGLPKIKTTATWIPWTYSRLTSASGYGAGVRSPAWYEHLWHHPDKVIEQWMARAAQVLRTEDLPASTASVIEAVRLSNALAAVRDHSLPGLTELMEAAQSVFCFGSDLPMRLVAEKLVVGERMGKVPDETPMVPLQRNFHQSRTRLNIPLEGHYGKKVRVEKKDGSHVWEEKPAALNLREDRGREQSALFHRIALLGIPWGKEIDVSGTGSFKEGWEFAWQPEFEIRLIQANVWGNTIPEATTATVRDTLAKLTDLPDLTRFITPIIKADIPDVLADLTTRIENVAAMTSDVAHLVNAMPGIANVIRYGENFVVKVNVQAFVHTADSLMVRICAGLPAACASLDDNAAATMFTHLVVVQNAVRLLQNENYESSWIATLTQIANRENLHGLIVGRACRSLMELGVMDAEEVGRRLNLALSTATDPLQAAAWLEGLVRAEKDNDPEAGGRLLLTNDSLWSTIDAWLCSLDPDTFIQLLPLLRRTFHNFPKAMRRQMGERVKAGGSGVTLRRTSAASIGIDKERAERVVPLLAKLLGLDTAGAPTGE